jgi:membrane associated rhomboid family serine protease
MLPILFFPFFFELPALIYIGFWFLSQVYSGTLSGLGPNDVGGVAWWAHVGGFLAGVVVHRLFLLPRGYEPDEYEIEQTWARRR